MKTAAVVILMTLFGIGVARVSDLTVDGGTSAMIIERPYFRPDSFAVMYDHKAIINGAITNYDLAAMDTTGHNETEFRYFHCIGKGVIEDCKKDSVYFYRYNCLWKMMTKDELVAYWIKIKEQRLAQKF